ncbi:YfiH family protein [Paenibacillus turicensis]|uniref:Purine nucleoside phosphorylase n=1 Tax=Paenibacillus turicensis TaxID=160487 RepID=A0ABS4FP73_9BACL|nr:YfiH family protein [Paenibacillus turicensis]
MEPFVRKYEENTPALYFLKKWMEDEPHLQVGFTGRQGGCSHAPYSSLNLAYHVDDNAVDVLQNRITLARAIGFEPSTWTCGEQVHGTQIAVVEASDVGKGYSDRESAFQNTDGLVTNVPNILLTSFYADCVPLYFFDKVKGVIGLAHAGWKGTVGQISKVMITTMTETYGCAPHHIYAAIGPSIGDCCYEVDEYVMSRVRETLADIGGDIDINVIASPSSNEGKSMLNLKELNRMIMIKAGILPEFIECTTWCTSCHPDQFFSYRKEEGTTGRMASWIGMKER